MERSRTMRFVCFQFKKTTCQTRCSCRTPKHCSWEPLTRDQIIACTYWLSSVLEQISTPLINSCLCAPTHARKHTHLPLTLSNAYKCLDLIGRCTWGDRWYAIGCCRSIKWSRVLSGQVSGHINLCHWGQMPFLILPNPPLCPTPWPLAFGTESQVVSG